MQEISQVRLRYFHEVVACGSIRGAADKLDTAPSVISRQIQLLEKELGVQLFERRSRGLAPTEAADMLLEYYRGCRAQQEHLNARLQEWRGMQRGNVHLMISEGFIDSLMEHVVGPFCIEFPQINISVNVGSVNEVVEAVATDAAHIGLAYNPPVDPRLRCRASRKHPVCLLAGRGHALARRRAPLAIADILPYPFALMSSPYGLRQAVDLLEFTERVHLTPSLTTNSLRVLKQYAMTGAGVTLMPTLGVHHELASGQLVAIPIEHPILSAPECQALLRLGRPLSSAANELARRIEQRLPAFAQR
ncbi:LysR family transcriptional regulator [Achromobacter denitrificans]|uniref:LysR family transcriptional regulator n=1 Tax=Achromobacter denitrificans TaxID=32002 RepID=A0A6N0JLV3_ACHDE|nr:MULTISPECIES: LysR family transcriptional regulator [Achromobacter]ASC68246.1 LysR family transcriptional regulator [Achromobacter denitrificans]MBV2159146.1 LysR family transcriptional regulator [Achromobacter denitrificans]MDX3881261.1 LysR family transcriptional regulator [Achromobacter sp.]QCS66473.1 LysR family transcriptional regulator [Achromobacter denitrificans]QKQ48072.1 LysR family transcriptional regulator [Achromobacter denitrificans]